METKGGIFKKRLHGNKKRPMGKVWTLVRKSYSGSALKIYVESAVSKADALGVAETFRSELEKFLGNM